MKMSWRTTSELELFPIICDHHQFSIISRFNGYLGIDYLPNLNAFHCFNNNNKIQQIKNEFILTKINQCLSFPFLFGKIDEFYSKNHVSKKYCDTFVFFRFTFCGKCFSQTSKKNEISWWANFLITFSML